ncbi:tRNA(adenine34) deaminase [Dimargaris verticillata]|uniref:tRNA(Adenine34) deaminase n=1 Tax=Dimargaris verticillata TaxID=2761393 RepID=A0A9W8BAX8_9FUNG|nr:tRNA(adenine34) deaminase [Dimargaris verticillata]
MAYSDDQVRDFMAQALAQAEEAFKAGEVPVGCVFVHNGTVIGRGRNRPNETRNATKHAELVAIDAIISQRTTALASKEPVDVNSYNHHRHCAPAPADIFAEADLFVTVEPCVMCASALRQIGIRSVYFGCHNERFGGCGSVLAVHDKPYGSHAPYPITHGIFKTEAVMLLRRFYLRENTSAPAPKKKANRTLKSVDGGTFSDFTDPCTTLAAPPGIP